MSPTRSQASDDTAGKGSTTQETPANIGQSPTTYDVAPAADVSIASASRVFNGHGAPWQETSNRVLQAVGEFGIMPGGAGRARAARFKEMVGVVFRRVAWLRATDTVSTACADAEGGLRCD